MCSGRVLFIFKLDSSIQFCLLLSIPSFPCPRFILVVTNCLLVKRKGNLRKKNRFGRDFDSLINSAYCLMPRDRFISVDSIQVGKPLIRPSMRWKIRESDTT